MSECDFDLDQIKKMIREDPVLSKIDVDKHLLLLKFLIMIPKMKTFLFANESGSKLIGGMLCDCFSSFKSIVITKSLERVTEKMKEPLMEKINNSPSYVKKIFESTFWKGFRKLILNLISIGIEKLITKITGGFIEKITEKCVAMIIETHLGQIIATFFLTTLTSFFGGILGWIIVKIVVMIIGMVVGLILKKFVNWLFQKVK